jgi:hypothetical protein
VLRVSNVSSPEMSIRGRMGAWAALVANGADAQLAAAHSSPNNPKNDSYWENRVDPDSRLAPSDRRQRAEAAKKLYFTRLAYKSARARSRNSP